MPRTATAERPTTSANGIAINHPRTALALKGERPAQAGGFGVRKEVLPLPDAVLDTFNGLAETEYAPMALITGIDKGARTKSSALVRTWKRSATEVHEGMGAFVVTTRRSEDGQNTVVWIGRDSERIRKQAEKLAAKAAQA
jgi:hypothetical protein